MKSIRVLTALLGLRVVVINACLAMAKDCGWNTVFRIAIGLGTFHCAPLFAEEKGLLFYASFDRSIHADFAKGCPDATGCAEITENAQGLIGEALIAKSGWYGVEQYTGVKYLFAGNLEHEAGTIEFHLKPLPGFFGRKESWRKIFLCMHDKTIEENRRLYRWFRIDCNYRDDLHKLRVFEQDMHLDKGSHLTAPSPALAVNQWCKIAYCWQGKDRALYFNDVLVATGETTDLLPHAGAHLYFGADPHGKSVPHALMDELRIWGDAKYGLK